MAVTRWEPTEDFTPTEELLMRRLARVRKLFSFLRLHRCTIFDDVLQDELAEMYRDSGAGKTPVPPALMAMATLLQGYVGASDAEAVEFTVVDLRWQLVLDCIGATKPAFSQGALHDFRHRMIKHDMDRRVLERTAEVARSTGDFDARKLPKSLRVAVDSAPLEGAGRVEDTVNLIAHAARLVVSCIATITERNTDEICARAGIPLLAFSSVKRGLDRDWTLPGEKEAAVTELAGQAESLLAWTTEHLPDLLERPPVRKTLATLRRVMDQDLEPDPEREGAPRIRDGVVKDRRISIEDEDMRHGRKSSSRRVNGYKRHIAKDLDAGVILACSVTPANQPEADAMSELDADIERQGGQIGELYVDRAYVSSKEAAEVAARGGEVIARPWRHANGDLFSKSDFAIDLEQMLVTCPAGEIAAARLGRVTFFPAGACDVCDLRPQCTRAKPGGARGRSIRIADDEPQQQQFRALVAHSEGRDRLRKRVPVEHSLAHVVYRQGRRARYLGIRTNLFDLRRASSIQNLEIAQRRAA